MENIEQILSAGDLRTVGGSGDLAGSIHNQEEFDSLFQYLFHPKRAVVMRAADVLEKVSGRQRTLLEKHESALISLAESAANKELKWHLAQMLPRVPLENALHQVWQILFRWVKDKGESMIVRVNALQGLSDLKDRCNRRKEFLALLRELQQENIKSLNARIRLLKDAPEH